MKTSLQHRLFMFVLLFSLALTGMYAQDVIIPKAQRHRQKLGDTLTLGQMGEDLDSLQRALLEQVRDSAAHADSLLQDSMSVVYVDSTKLKIKKNFVPDPKRALWMAIAFPGGGQIYNRKYWKLPIIYGGFLGCFYALNWNNNMYRDYSQAYIDITDADPKTKSYEKFLPPTYDVDSHIDRLKEIFQRKKDFYRRYRDLSFFCMLGVYGLSIVDAYVDAELSSFDISPDLSIKVHPTVISDGHNYLAQHGLGGNSYGFQCTMDF